MRQKLRQLATTACLSLCALSGSGASAEGVIDINSHWRFQKGDVSSAKQKDFDDSRWRVVNLPHDWSIEDLEGQNSPFTPESIDVYDTGYTVGGVAWYRKPVFVPESLEGKVAYLGFGGIYLNSDVYVNGTRVGGQHNGYTSFYMDISKQLNYGQNNVIAVRVDNNHKNSRWYSGSGIYRKAQLTFVPKVHISYFGSQVEPRVVDKSSAVLAITPKLENLNQAKQPVRVEYQVLDNHAVIATSALQLDPQQQSVVHDVDLHNIQLWGPNNPKLYSVRENLYVGDQKVQSRDYRIGIRDIRFSAKQGMLLNGEPVLLQGMNLHHDNYMLGAAAYPDAEQRKVKLILEAGYNAARTSHNPPSQAFLDAADAQGLLVIAEAFDSWNERKWDHENAYSSVFTQDWERDLTNFIHRDVNHPSIIMWSLGNEIPEQSKPLGVKTAKMLKDKLLLLDDSRPVTIGANYSGPESDDFLSNFHVVGYNYQEHNFAGDHKRFPQRVMYGAETYSNEAFSNWQRVLENPYVIGDFVWTGWDYLGEASIGWTGYAPEWKGIGPYPWHLAYCGEIDALGFKRPAAYYRDVLWRTGNNPISAFVKSPTLSLQPAPKEDWYLMWQQPDIHPNWTWPNAGNAPLEVEVYSLYPEVELQLNGEVVGKRFVSKATEYKAKFTVDYQPGVLEAVAYDKGQRVDSWRLQTAQEPARIALQPDSVQMKADGEDLIYVTVQLYDEKDTPNYHWSQDLPVEVSISGPAELAGIGNGNPVTAESFQGPVRSTFRGRLVAVLKSVKGQAGDVEVTFTAKKPSGKILSQIIQLTSAL
jgi:beta-galactosidase